MSDLCIFHILLINIICWLNESSSLPSPSSKYYPKDDDIELMDKVFLKRSSDPFPLILRPVPPELVRNFTFSSQPHPKYKWTVAGSEDCMPAISCSVFELAERNNEGSCDQMWMEVTDGIAGIDRFCGNIGPNQTVAANQDGLRDLYITLKNNLPGKHPRLNCTIQCGHKDTAVYLPKQLTQPKVNLRCVCGTKPQRNRIIGGKDTYFGEFPWLAAIVVKGTRQPFCTGSVINDRMILTAGHCFKGRFRKVWNFQIVLNGFMMDSMPNINVKKHTTISYMTYDDDTLDKLDSGNNSFRFDADKYYIHPLYESNRSDFDTAVILLSKKIDLNAFRTYSPICLPELKYIPDSYAGMTAAISGWGLPAVDAQGTIVTMKQITVDVYPPDSCKKFFGERFVSSRRQLCAAYPDASQDSCAGDSGGPLSLEIRRQVWYQIGIISWGDSCAVKNSPGVYYRTTSTNQWIRYMSNRKEAVWCDVPL